MGEKARNTIDLNAVGTAQYFWHDSDGAHVTKVTKEQYEAAPSDAGGNTLITTEGMAIRDGINELGIFSTNGIQIGNKDKQRLQIFEDGVYAYNEDGINFFSIDYDGAQITSDKVVNLRGEYGFDVDSREINTVMCTQPIGQGLSSGTQLLGNTTPLSFMIYNTRGAGFNATISPTLTNCTLSNFNSNRLAILIPLPTITIGTDMEYEATAIVQSRLSSVGAITFNVIIKYVANTEQIELLASMSAGTIWGPQSFSFRSNSKEAYQWSLTTTAPSFMFGTRKGNPGLFSSVLGENIYATKDNQTVIGKYNIEDTESTTLKQKAFIVGNGTADNARSNAFTIDWSGNTKAMGEIEDGNGNKLSDALMEDTNGDLSITHNISAGGDIEDALGNILSEKLDGLDGVNGRIGITLGQWKICWGTVSITPSSGTTSGSGTFSSPYYKDANAPSEADDLIFSADPYVWVQLRGAWSGSNWATPHDLSRNTSTGKTTFKIRLYSSAQNTTARNIRWLAIGKA